MSCGNPTQGYQYYVPGFKIFFGGSFSGLGLRAQVFVFRKNTTAEGRSESRWPVLGRPDTAKTHIWEFPKIGDPDIVLPYQGSLHWSLGFGNVGIEFRALLRPSG